MNVLFLDDCPDRQSAFRGAVPDARIVATACDLIDELKKDCPDTLFLDHDLGGEVYVDSSREDCGMEVVRWLLTHKPAVPLIVVHTMNEGAGSTMDRQLRSAGYKVERVPFGSPGFRAIVRWINSPDSQQGVAE